MPCQPRQVLVDRIAEDDSDPGQESCHDRLEPLVFAENDE